MVTDILHAVPDELVLGEVTADNRPVFNLYNQYLAIQRITVTSKQLDENSTGKDLKEAVQLLPVELRLKLINQFFNDQKISLGLSTETTTFAIQGDADESVVTTVMRDRKLRNWIIMFVMILIGVIVLMVIGSVIAIGMMTGSITDGFFVNTIMNTAIEVIKLILGSGI